MGSTWLQHGIGMMVVHLPIVNCHVPRQSYHSLVMHHLLVWQSALSLHEEEKMDAV